MPPFDESKYEPMPEVQIDPDDEFHVDESARVTPTPMIAPAHRRHPFLRPRRPDGVRRAAGAHRRQVRWVAHDAVTGRIAAIDALVRRVLGL